MKKIYLIPGLGENCNLIRYKKLAVALKKKGYVVIGINPDWYQPLSEQIFSIEKDSMVCGFSFGAVLAYLVAQKYPCEKAILASLSPIHKFSYTSLKKDYMSHMSEEKAEKIAKDIKQIKINLNNIKTPIVTLVGENEKIMKGEKMADFIVPKAEHFMTGEYIECILKLV